MTRTDFLHWATTRLLPSIAAPGASITEGHGRRHVIVSAGVSLAVDASDQTIGTSIFFSTLPWNRPLLTVRVRLVSDEERLKKQWKYWHDIIHSGDKYAYPGFVVPRYGASGNEAFFGFEWEHPVSLITRPMRAVGDYADDAEWAEHIALWLLSLLDARDTDVPFVIQSLGDDS